MPSLHDMLCFPPDNFVSHEVKRWHNVFCRAPGPSHPQSIARAITQLKTRDVFPAGSVSVSLSLSLPSGCFQASHTNLENQRPEVFASSNLSRLLVFVGHGGAPVGDAAVGFRDGVGSLQRELKGHIDERAEEGQEGDKAGQEGDKAQRQEGDKAQRQEGDKAQRQEGCQEKARRKQCRAREAREPRDPRGRDERDGGWPLLQCHRGRRLQAEAV